MTIDYSAGMHDYLSTACLHGEHGYCQGADGERGPKRPAQCKFCDAPCLCACHVAGAVTTRAEVGREAHGCVPG